MTRNVLAVHQRIADAVLDKILARAAASADCFANEVVCTNMLGGLCSRAFTEKYAIEYHPPSCRRTITFIGCCRL